MTMPDLTVELLKQIRDGVHATRTDLVERLDLIGGKLDQTNARLDQTNARLDQTNSRLGRLEGSVAELVGHVSTLADLDRNRGSAVEDLRRRVEALETRVGV
jgi:uncharacterized coiled-coil DUF342 family protein